MTDLTDFDAASATTPAGDLRWSVDLPADWAQGRTTFGGLVGAIAARVAAEVVGAERPIRTLDLAFVAPLPAGPAVVEAEVLGTGKAVTQLVISVRGEALGARVHVVAGAARESGAAMEIGPAMLVAGDPADQGIELSYVPGVTPEFTRRLDYRWCSSTFPYTGTGPEGAVIDGWIRHRSEASGLPALIALLDAYPPSVLPMLTRPAPGSTVRWALHLAAPSAVDLQPVDAGKQWFWYEARTVQAGEGYATAYASLYTDSGRLLAWSEQLVAVYA
jgi:acyl-CoA thioesterase